MTNQNRNYPARMHEVLGVESKEMFALNGDPDNPNYYLTDDGDMFLRYGTANKIIRMAHADEVFDAINQGITRRPRLTDEQVDQLKALVTLGYRWLVEERGGTVVAVNHEVKKGEVRWVLTNPRDSDDVVCDVHQSLSVKSLVSWSDPAPLDIVQTLRDAGRLEVES